MNMLQSTKNFLFLMTLTFSSTFLLSQTTSICSPYNYTIDSNRTFVAFGVQSFIQTWTFDDGLIQRRGNRANYPNDTNVVYTYIKDGIFIITLRVDTPGFSPWCTRKDTIIVNKLCRAKFNYFDNQNGRIDFIDKSLKVDSNLVADTNLMYHWDFGDSSTSNTRNPIHYYKKNGSYSVNLIISDSLNSCSDTVSETLNVRLDSNVSCASRFSYKKDSARANGIIIENNSTNNSWQDYLWDFGDGNFDSLRNPFHQYQNFGKYKVCLTISSNNITCSAYCDSLGLDSLGNLKSVGFSIEVRDTSFVTAFPKVNFERESLSINPNPTSNFFYIQNIHEFSNSTLTIYDKLGKIVKMLSLNNLHNKIDIGDLNNGIYFISITIGNKIYNTKILKN